VYRHTELVAVVQSLLKKTIYLNSSVVLRAAGLMTSDVQRDTSLHARVQFHRSLLYSLFVMHILFIVFVIFLSKTMLTVVK